MAIFKGGITTGGGTVGGKKTEVSGQKITGGITIGGPSKNKNTGDNESGKKK
ncbi:MULTISPECIES: hypothetical protein [unclassified Streptomyces]|uniref:hypothetical protein n=1 Tax=unclassified Streptomyces TaxID=2593676 RepID=UPI002E1AF179